MEKEGGRSMRIIEGWEVPEEHAGSSTFPNFRGCTKIVHQNLHCAASREARARALHLLLCLPSALVTILQDA